MKVCTGCGESKPDDRFCAGKWRGRRCKLCATRSHTAYMKSHPEQRRKAQAKKTISNRRRQELFMVIRLKARCKLNGIPFNLEEKDVRIPEVCPVLGIKISRSFSTKEAPVSRDDRPSLDRLVPSLGYVKGNVWVISGRANRLRNDATVTELRAIASAIDLRLFRMKSHAQITGSL